MVLIMKGLLHVAGDQPLTVQYGTGSSSPSALNVMPTPRAREEGRELDWACLANEPSALKIPISIHQMLGLQVVLCFPGVSLASGWELWSSHLYSKCFTH